VADDVSVIDTDEDGSYGKTDQKQVDINKFRRATGYTIAKRRLRMLREKMFSFSPLRKRTVHRRIIIPYDDDDDDESCDEFEEVSSKAADNSMHQAETGSMQAFEHVSGRLEQYNVVD